MNYNLISLNLWGGYVFDPLLKFVSTYNDIDIFCFQELYKDAPRKFSTDDKKVSLELFSILEEKLPNHTGLFTPVVENWYGIGVFIKNEIKILDSGSTSIHENPGYSGWGPTHSRKMQWAKLCLKNDNELMILNVHGLWNGEGKTDTPERINQSRKIKEFMNSMKIPMIVCGDFNLLPTTESIKIVSTDMADLISKYKIKSTRTSLYEKTERFADYMFTSKNVSIKDFRVLPEEVSDHSALLLKFSL